MIPSSTYRVQLNKDFTLKELRAILDYLHTLGASTVYASPILSATPGSIHGYDVTDPHIINPEIGSVESLTEITHELAEKEMSWIQDIVPNHMAFNSFNTRLMDVLERGPGSAYYEYFDINWNHPSAELKGKVIAPFLGDTPEQCIDRKEIQLSFGENGCTINYFDQQYPVSLPAYGYLLSCSKTVARENRIVADLKDYIAQALALPDLGSWMFYKKQWIASLSGDPSRKGALDEIIRSINEDKNSLAELMSRQYYLLTAWKRAEKEINYRRFFTVNGLICLRMEDGAVFDEYHTLLHSLYKENIVQGLRIDHIDGLNDPSQYLKRLRHRFGNACYIIAEKILEEKEEMPAHWPLQGTSGYEFLAFTSQLFTDRKGARLLERFYRDLVPELSRYNELVYQNKKLVLEEHMTGEWNNLTHYLLSLQLNENFDVERIRQALALFMLSLPVYRIYPEQLPLTGKSLVVVKETCTRARQVDPDYKTELDYFERLFTGPPSNASQHRRILLFLKRLMQFTGPLTAKGVEDTTFYVYNPLISHDEVGDAPSTLGITIQSFHTKMLLRSASTPLSLNTTATHDTKRGEDARLRLNVLSTVPEEWSRQVEQWLKMNELFHRAVNGSPAPSVNDEYFIYQSIVGGFPEDLMVTDEWIGRFQEYLQKAVREAKVNSRWEAPDKAYEEACAGFVTSIFDPSHTFLQRASDFMKKIIRHANLNALGQVLIKITAPGIPDIYQGCELWDLSYVDPDNRRPVDYEKRIDYLNNIIETEKKGKEALFSFLHARQDTGMEKLFVTWKALCFRRAHSRLFNEGAYLPIQVVDQGTATIAYARHLENEWVLVLVPLKLSIKDHNLQPDKDALKDFNIIPPENAPDHWINILTGESFTLRDQASMQKIFDTFPVALLYQKYL